LTRGDITKLVNDKLRNTQAAELGQELIARANEVFLWVNLAVKDVLRGVTNEDSYIELQSRLTTLPQKIEDLYLHMLRRIDKPYQEEAKLFLRLVQNETDESFSNILSLLRFGLATYDGIEAMFACISQATCHGTDSILASAFEESDLERLASASLRVQKQVVIRCAGLLEVHTSPVDGSETAEDTESFRSATHMQLVCFGQDIWVDFIHESAYHFLRSDKRAIEFLQSNSSLDADAATRLFKARLVELRLLPRLPDISNYTDEIKRLLRRAERISEFNADLSVMLLDITDGIFRDFQRGYENRQICDEEVVCLVGTHPSQLPALVGVAAWCGNFEYVLRKLDQLPPAELTEEASRMLVLTLLSSPLSLEALISQAKELFSRGASGNKVFKVPFTVSMNHKTGDFVVESVTGWKIILDELAALLQDNLLESGRIGRILHGEKLTFYSLLVTKFLSQSIDPDTMAEVMLNIKTTDYRSGLTGSKSQWVVSTMVPVDSEPALVMSMFPDFVLRLLFESLTHVLPSEMRNVDEMIVTQVKLENSEDLHDLSETQADYLMEAIFSLLDDKSSQPARKILYNRVVEVIEEISSQLENESDG
jgi:hypothetical protein